MNLPLLDGDRKERGNFRMSQKMASSLSDLADIQNQINIRMLLRPWGRYVVSPFFALW